MPRSVALFVVIGALSAGCARTPPPLPVPPGASVTVVPAEEGLPTDWKTVALPDDAARIATLEASWATALMEAQATRLQKAIAEEGELLKPDAALARPAPPPGRYRCRIVRVGHAREPRKAFERFKPYFCFVEAERELLTFTKGTGTQRPGGRLWNDNDTRMIFLGGVADRETDPTPAYGADPRQNRVGVVERVGEFRWRLTMPGRGDAERLEIIELIPDTPPPPPPSSFVPIRR